MGDTNPAQTDQLAVYPWDPGSATAQREFDEVIELHREHKSTLGHLPFAAFKEAGNRGRLVLGRIDGVVNGYLLYSTPRHQSLKLVHVCVGAAARGRGLAKAMATSVIEANPDRVILSAHCRSDYGIDGFWRSLDMTPSGERPGRAAAGSTLTIWTRRIGQLDLLESALYDSARVLAVLDSNIVIDQFSSEKLDRPDRQESLGISADWLSDLVDLAISPEVEVDVNGLQPADERIRVQRGMAALVPLRRHETMRVTAAALIARMPDALLATDPSLSNDAQHLADAILAGADFFVTRDQNLLNATDNWALHEFQIEVVRPVDLIQRFIPPVALSEFRSDLLESVGLKWVNVSSVGRAIEESFLSTAQNEKGTRFRKQLHATLARPATATLRELIDERERRWALVATEQVGRTLSVPTIRVGRGRLGGTIAFQLIRYLRELGLANGAEEVVVQDSSIAETLRDALEVDGFTGSPPGIKLSEHPDPGDIAALDSPEEVAAYERTNWPQVVTGKEVPVWIIPIQPRFARELLGFNETLLHLRERPALGLAREFVYFASPRVKHWTLPARVVWYVTKDDASHDRKAVRAAVAHSRLVDSAIVGVEDAVAQFRSLGVLREREIRARAHKGEVLVLRFEDTHEFSSPIGRQTLNSVLKEHGVTTSLLTMRAAVPAFFDELLSLSQRSENQ